MNFNPTTDDHNHESPVCVWCDEPLDCNIQLVGCSPMHPGCLLKYHEEMERIENERDAKSCSHCAMPFSQGDAVLTHAVGVIHESCEAEVNHVLGCPITPDRPTFMQSLELMLDGIITMIWPDGRRAYELDCQYPNRHDS